MVASLYKLKARYHDPAFNSCPEKNDVHLEANSNEIAAVILTPHCTPGSKVNLCKTNYIIFFFTPKLDELMNFQDLFS